MLELIVYPKPKDIRLINNSPFCAKTEIFLRLAKIEHQITNFNGNPSKFKNSKLPVIHFNGKYICDSSHIKANLCDSFDIELDSHLSPSEMAIGHAFSCMVEDNFYWSILHERWFIENNWIRLKSDYFGHMPLPIRWFVPSIIQKNVLKSSKGHGMSRHSDQDIHEFGHQVIKSISHFLGEKKFLFGEKVSSYDATIYAFISNVMHSPYGPELSKAAKSYTNLIEYDNNMFKETYE